MKNVVFDMETGDPDDIFALCFLTSHPEINLVGVTVTPGTNAQIGIVKYILDLTDHTHVPVGSRTPGYEKDCVSAWHYGWLGKVQPAKPDGEGCDIMYEAFRKNPGTLITGAALTNPHRMFTKYSNIKIEEWVAQGGFAGDNIVPKELRLEKFDGKITCPTYNFNGDPKAALALLDLAGTRIKRVQLVSKNVCHGVLYDKEFHAKVEPYKDKTPGLRLIYIGMSRYLRKKKRAKAFHDPLAACTAVNQSICDWNMVSIYREKGQWGSNPGSGPTFISVKVDMDLFAKTLTTT